MKTIQFCSYVNTGINPIINNCLTRNLKKCLKKMKNNFKKLKKLKNCLKKFDYKNERYDTTFRSHLDFIFK